MSRTCPGCGRADMAGITHVCPPVETGGVVTGSAEYVYVWGNNPRRAALKGRSCVIEATGAMGTALVRFTDNGERVTTSRRALRAAAPRGER